MDELERQLRDVLTSDDRYLPSHLVPLGEVHAGASRRLRRRRMVAASASASLVAFVGLAVFATSPSAQLDRRPEPPAQPSQQDSREPTVEVQRIGAPWDDAKVRSVTATSTQTIVVHGDLDASPTTGPCTVATCTRLAESHDGGATFSPLPAPADEFAQDALAKEVNGVRFGSGSDGWLFGDEFWATHDGGETWSHVKLPGAIRRLEAAAGRAWALVDAGVGNSLELWSSPVGTDSWASAGVEVTSPGDLAVQGQRVVVVGSGDREAWTNSGGDRFTAVAGPCPGTGDVRISALDSLWAACAADDGTDVRVSSDGRSWTDVGLNVDDNGRPGGRIAIGAHGSGEAIVSVSPDVFLRLTSGGEPLPSATIEKPPGGGVADYIGFTTLSVGYAITSDGLWRTDDGGEIWRQLQIG